MALKIWRGDAPAVAQITRITPANVQIGDTFTLTINGKSITVTATAGTVSHCCGLLAAAIAATTIPEFSEFTVLNTGAYLDLTASTAGVPFTITGTTSNGGQPTVVVTTTTEGAPAGSATNQTHTFRIPLSAAGQFQIFWNGAFSALTNVGASAATVQTNMEAMSTIGAGNVAVAKTSDTNDDIYTVTWQGTFAGTNVAAIAVTLLSTKPLVRTTQEGSSTSTLQNEIQTVDVDGLHSTAGITFTLTYGAFTSAAIATNADVATITSALEVSGICAVLVTKTLGLITIEFEGMTANSNVSQLVASVYSGSNIGTHTQTITLVSAAGSISAVNEVQLVTLTGIPTSGTFTLTHSGNTTGPLAYNISTSLLSAALQLLASIGSGNVTVTGSAGGPYTVTFVSGKAGTNMAQMTGDGSSLVGGNDQGLTVTTPTASSGPNHWDTPENWLPSGVPITGDDVRFEIGSSECLYGLSQSGVTLATLIVAMTYTGKIGLPRNNASDYLEYRPFELAIGATSILIGQGEGSGPSKVAINTGTVQTALEVRDSGGSSDSGIPAVIWRGTHTSNAVTIFGGEVGLAPYSDQSANVLNLIQRGGSLDAKHTAFGNSLLFTSAKFFDCTLNGKAVEAY